MADRGLGVEVIHRIIRIHDGCFVLLELKMHDYPVCDAVSHKGRVIGKSQGVGADVGVPNWRGCEPVTAEWWLYMRHTFQNTDKSGAEPTSAHSTAELTAKSRKLHKGISHLLSMLRTGFGLKRFVRWKRHPPERSSWVLGTVYTTP